MQTAQIFGNYQRFGLSALVNSIIWFCSRQEHSILLFSRIASLVDICFLPAWFYDADGRGGGIFFREQAIALMKVLDRVDLFYPTLHPQYFGKTINYTGVHEFYKSAQ